MTAFKFLSLATAAIFFVDMNPADAAAATPSAKSVSCLDPMNKARNLVGFTALTAAKNQGEILPIVQVSSGGSPQTSGDAYVKAVCNALQASPASPASAIAVNGTYAYAAQDGADADCEAAVEHWKEAVDNFNGPPPQYKAGDGVYANPQNISFISLFNPQNNPKLDCAYFTCPASASSEQGDGGLEEEEDEPKQEEGEKQTQPGQQQSGSVGVQTVSATADQTAQALKALLCVTTPNALKDNTPPFTDDQWSKITAGLKKGAASDVSTFLAFAATAVGFLFL
ncbi:SAG family member [Eimeria praecox]|uniref:SAG family member n=1 Tax=Eimeria praecox TaxID=51316 RepID=U6G692_9EIME|nr:SAG family member [Eimeria praecox]